MNISLVENLSKLFSDLRVLPSSSTAPFACFTFVDVPTIWLNFSTSNGGILLYKIVLRSLVPLLMSIALSKMKSRAAKPAQWQLLSRHKERCNRRVHKELSTKSDSRQQL